MPLIRLFHSTASPYVRKVMVCAHEKGLADAVELLESAAWPVAPDGRITPHNPVGKVPTALLSDGQALFDSRVICAFLDSQSDAPRLVPEAGPERFRILTLEALGDAMLDAALLCRYEAVLRPEPLRWPDWQEGQMAKVDSSLRHLEDGWLPVLERGVTLGSIAVGCALGYLDFRFADKDWRGAVPGLAGWFAGFDARPAMQATRPA